jgi:hypothetical protein
MIDSATVTWVNEVSSTVLVRLLDGTFEVNEFKPIADFKFPYSKIERSSAKWVTLRVKPTNLPKDFVICLNFNPTSTKGVFISHDADGKSLVGLPNKMAGSFSGGDWMVRAIVDKAK